MGGICGTKNKSDRREEENVDIRSVDNEDFDGGVKRVWAGIELLDKQGRGGKHGTSYTKSTKRKVISSSKGETEVLVEHQRTLGTPTTRLGTPTTIKTVSG